MSEDGELVTIFRSRDLSEQAFVASVLDEAGIPFLEANTEVQNLIGAGQIGGMNLLTGPVEIRVSREHAETAKNLLAGAELPVAGYGGDAETREERDPISKEDGIEEASRFARYSIVWAVLWLGGIGSLFAIYFGLRSLKLIGNQVSALRWKARLGVAMGVMGVIMWCLVWGGPLLGRF